FSPDDRWLAYQSNEMGRTQLWVQPFPATGAKYPIVEGGQPFWSADGKELFYNTGGLTAVVNITTRPNFAFSEPMPVPRGPLIGRAPVRNFDVRRDGKHFRGFAGADQNQSAPAAAPQIQVVLNWFHELQERVPVK